MLAFTNLKAQDYPLPLIMEGKVTDPQYGLPTNMVYQTILETNLKQKEFIKNRFSIGAESFCGRKRFENRSNYQ